MDTHEFLALSQELDRELRQDYHQHELYSYMTVWLKSRMPSLYKELEANFRGSSRVSTPTTPALAQSANDKKTPFQDSYGKFLYANLNHMGREDWLNLAECKILHCLQDQRAVQLSGSLYPKKRTIFTTN